MGRAPLTSIPTANPSGWPNDARARADFAREVREYGLAATIKTDSQPGVAELVEVEGPGGNVFQFYSTVEAPTPGFKETGVSLLRLGHVAVISTEAEKLMKFYQEFLGCWYTDDIAGIANFFTCNRDHHVVNIVNAPESRVHHIAFELRGTAHHTAAAHSGHGNCGRRRRDAGALLTLLLDCLLDLRAPLRTGLMGTQIAQSCKNPSCRKVRAFAAGLVRCRTAVRQGISGG